MLWLHYVVKSMKKGFRGLQDILIFVNGKRQTQWMLRKYCKIHFM